MSCPLLKSSRLIGNIVISAIAIDWGVEFAPEKPVDEFKERFDSITDETLVEIKQAYW